LLTTAAPTAPSAVVDDAAKVNVVPTDFKEHPATVTSKADVVPDEDEDLVGQSKPSSRKKKAQKRLEEAEEEGLQLWHTAKQYILRPGVAGGLIGIGALIVRINPVWCTHVQPVNIGLLASVGRTFYVEPSLRRDAKAIGATIAGTLAVLSVEGYAAARYAQTPAGQAEAQRSKEEGSLIYRQSREVVLRPGVLGGLVGIGKFCFLLPEECAVDVLL
jgi:hypothetical protein